MRAWLSKMFVRIPRIRAITQDTVERAAVPDEDKALQLEQGSLRLLSEAFLASAAASRVQQHRAANAALFKIQGRPG